MAGPLNTEDAPAGGPSGWLAYLLECADGTYYCGVTCHMVRRLAQHNGTRTGGAKYTRARRPVRLLATLPCAGKAEAQRQEARIKSLPRRQKLAFFAAGSPLPPAPHAPAPCDTASGGCAAVPPLPACAGPTE